ncbi:protein of unknown function [Ralstonia solanacearum CMR15]|nr:protein of unknown function [Ralstonia solanacearum CMR15]
MLSWGSGNLLSNTANKCRSGRFRISEFLTQVYLRSLSPDFFPQTSMGIGFVGNPDALSFARHNKGVAKSGEGL